jgi:hypothetical protein
MKKILFGLLWLPIVGMAQKDSFQMPLVVHITPIFTKRSVGSQIGVQVLRQQKDLYRKHHTKLIQRERWLDLNATFYYHQHLHNAFSLTGGYAFRRRNSSGFYQQLRPFLGISKTFLNEETYRVNEQGAVELSKFAGDFYATTGLNLELGKVFKSPTILDNIHAGVLLQVYYPNFRFIALQSFFSVGTAIKIDKIRKTFTHKPSRQ